MRTEIRPGATTAAVGLALLLLVNVLIWRSAFDSVSATPTSLRASTPPPIAEEDPQTKVDNQAVVVVIGDSFTGGSDMNAGPVWLDQLALEDDWITRNLSVGGTGYIQGEPTDDFAARVTNPTGIQADLVIFAGGYNDVTKYPNADIARAARDAIAAAPDAFPGADVLVLSTWASGPPSDLQRDMASRLKAVAAAEGDQYLDVLGALTADQIGSDGVHPTDAGHAAMAAFVQAGLDRLGLPRPDAYQLP